MDSSQTAAAEQKRLIQKAQQEFSRKKYEECRSVLNSIESYDGTTEKLVHNQLIAEFYQKDLRSVNEILKRFEPIVRDDPKAMKPELAYLYYNYALILYHKRQMKKSLKILKHLQRIVESGDQYDELLSAHVFLLMLTILSEIDHKLANALLEKMRQGNAKKYLNVFEEGANQWDFKDMWQLLAHRVDVLNQTEVKLNMKPDSSEYCVLRAHQHFLKHDLQMAAKELSKKFHNDPFTISRNGENQDTVLANNMGLIHFSVRHYALAVRFFQYALNFDNLASENVLNNAVLVEMSACRRPEILYNLGVSMLYLERPQEAFDCLLVPLNYHHNNPRLWLRLAEACIMVHKTNLKNKTNNHLLTCGVIGSGMLRKFILKPTEQKYKTNFSENYAIPNPNLEFASLCLSNALILVKNIEAQLTLKDKEKPVPSRPSNPMQQSMVSKLKWTILSNLSYCYLYLGDFTSSLKYGMELLEQKEISTSFKFLGNMYCAEALIMMDRPQQVFPYMNPVLLKDFNPQDFESHASPGWQCTSFELTKAIFHYNSAVSLVMMNGHSKAGVMLAKCQHPDIIDHVMKLKVYLDLYFGSIDLPRNLALIEDKCLK